MMDKMQQMMGQLQQAQQEAEKIKGQLDTVHLKEESDEVSITITGNREIKDITVSESLLQDREELQDKLVVALNKAIKKADETNEKEMQKAAQGMMPGDMFK